MNPTCKCGQTMKQHVTISGFGYFLLNRFSCPLRTMWNFWKHDPETSMKDAQVGSAVLPTPPSA